MPCRILKLRGLLLLAVQLLLRWCGFLVDRNAAKTRSCGHTVGVPRVDVRRDVSCHLSSRYSLLGRFDLRAEPSCLVKSVDLFVFSHVHVLLLALHIVMF